jgi:thiol-disulfide isomerase/thioredoxin
MRAALIALSLALMMVVAASAADTVELGERDDGDIKKWTKVMGKKQPTLVFFYDPNCGHCRGFMPEFEAAAAEFGSGVTFAKINVVRWDELKAKYDVRRVPDIRFCSVGRDDDCTPYPEYSPNTKAGVLDFLSGRGSSRFAQAHADADADTDSQVASLSESELAAVLATKGTCEVPPHAPAHAEADADAVLGEDEDEDTSGDVEAESSEFDNESDAFSLIEDEAEAEVEAELNVEDEAEAEDEEESEAEEEADEEAESEAEAESEQQDS